MSAKRKSDIVVYSMLREKFLSRCPQCQIQAPGCTKKATVVHHTRGRILYYLIVSTWMASCAGCNLFIERNDAWARLRGFFKSKFEPLEQ